MRKRRIGGLEVSVVGVGCANFGRELDATQTRQVMYAAFDQGINFFDTADVYGRPRTLSEEYMGQAIAAMGSRRDELIIASKFGRNLDDAKAAQERAARLDTAYVRSATEASLRRLKTDRIDLMQLHHFDPQTPLEETIGALAGLVAEGKIREIGVSNYGVERLRAADAAARSSGLRGIASTQSEYSLLNRKAESSVLAHCEKTGMTMLPYFPLYSGLLTGKYRPGQPLPPGSRMALQDQNKRAALLSGRNMKIIGDLIAFAETRGHTLLELAFAWLLAHPGIPTVISGVTSIAQLAANAAASKWELTAAELAEVNRLAPFELGYEIIPRTSDAS